LPLTDIDSRRGSQYAPGAVCTAAAHVADNPGKHQSIYALPPEERLALLVNAVTGYAIYLIDLQGNVASWNAGAQRIKGYVPQEIIGQHFSRFFTEEDQQADLPSKALAIASKRAASKSKHGVSAKTAAGSGQSW
jgi:PAS domain S-box-containing protein